LRAHEITAPVEVLTGASAAGAKVALFDFDGTLSLIRAGWIDVMVPMMVEALADLHTGESDAELTAVVRDFVDRLTGKQTVYQMIELSRQITLRGGTPYDPIVYKKRYLDLLHARISHRLEELRQDSSSVGKYVVPGSLELLDALRLRGLTLYLASGTDQDYMRAEADLLGVTPFFNGGVFGALDDYKSFSKKMLIERIIAGAECSGSEILGFGDGYVEIENVKTVGGVAVGVASDELECLKVDAWKRDRLASVGADYIVPNYLSRVALFERLFAL
jgi:phosphoglycolate phosphatase-like HAD superfamily hydrolase